MNKANRYTALFPAKLGDAPIRIELGSAWLQFSPIGLTGAGTMSGNSMSYALPNATLTYRTSGDSVNEGITLDSPAAPTAYQFSIQLSPGLTLRAESTGAIAVVNPGGATPFSFAPPFMMDHHGALSPSLPLSLASSGSGYTLTMSADTAWLADPQRAYPVLIDPTVYLDPYEHPNDEQDCSIVQGTPTTSYCSGYDTDWVGGAFYGAYRTLLYFNVADVVPSNATVTQAVMGLFEYTQDNTTNSLNIGAYQVTRAGWNQSATWNTYDGVNAWTTPGGDFNSSAAATTTVSPTDNWYFWYLTSLAQGWVSGTTANDGVILKEVTEDEANRIWFENDKNISEPPFLEVTYDHVNTGVLPWYSMVTDRLTDHLGLAVNVANGNLNLQQQNETRPGVGLPLPLGERWDGLTGNVRTNAWWPAVPYLIYFSSETYTGSREFIGPNGYDATFVRNANGTFTDAPGLDASLVQNGDGTYTLTFHQSGLRYNFGGANYGPLTSIVDRNGNTISYNYDSGGDLLSITDTTGKVTSYTYNGSGQLTQITDPANQTFKFTYDSNGNVQTYTDANGKVTTYGYTKNASGLYNLTQITDPLNNVTTIAYDGNERVTSVTLAATSSSPAKTTFTYNSGNTVVTDPNSHATTYTYDTIGRATSIKDPATNTTTQTWTSDDHLASITRPSGAKTTFTYNSSNDLTQVSTLNVSGTQSLTESWAFGNINNAGLYQPTSFTDPQGHATTYGYTTAGNLTTVGDANGHTTTYGYNSNGTLASVTDPNSHVTSYGYTSGMLTSITYPSGSTLHGVSYTYNTAELPASVADNNGTASYTYDPLGRLTQITYPGTLGSTIDTFDADGNRLTLKDPGAASSTSYTYNGLNQLTKITYPNSNIVSATYDGVGDMLTKVDGGGTVTYGYTPDNQVQTVTQPNGTKITLGYNTDGDRTSIAFPNSITETLAYNPASQLTSISSSLSSTTYGYNNSSGTPTALRYTVNGVSNTYDPLNRLTAAGSSDSYGYDPAGNLTSKTINGTQTSYTYNSGNELTTSGYSYDANGNLKGGVGGFTASYNTANQASTINSVSQSYTDVGQSFRTANGTTTFQNDPTGIGTMISGSTTSSFTRLPDGTLLGERILSGGSTSYYYDLTDGNGSVLKVVDSSGTVKNSYVYDPYGNATTASETVSNPFRFDGTVWDSTPKVYKMGARYYDPSTGRWTQLDLVTGVMQAPQSLNRYAFVEGDPVLLTDATGLCNALEFAEAGLGLAFGIPATVSAGLAVPASGPVAPATAFLFLGALAETSIAAGRLGACLGQLTTG